MIFKDGILLVTAIVVAIFFGTLAIIPSVAAESTFIRDLIESTSYRVTLITIFGLFITLSIYTLRRNHMKYESKIKAIGKGGTFYVLVSAVEESLERISMMIPEVLHAKVRIFKDRKETKQALIRVNFHALEDTIAPDVADKLRKNLTFRYAQIVGGDNEPQFEITIAKIVTKGMRHTSSKKSQEVVDLSKGPVYPIE